MSAIPGFSAEEAEKFKQAGYETLRDLSGVTEEMLLYIPDVEPADAARLMENIQAAFVRFDEDEDDEMPSADENSDANDAEEGEAPKA